MKKISLILLTSLMVMAGVMGNSVASAGESDGSKIRPKEEYPESVVKLVEEAHEGPISDEGVDLLVTHFPELAAVTPDYRPEMQQRSLETLPVSGNARATGSGCSGATGTHYSTTLLGLPFYNMTTQVNFCWSGSNVYSVTNLRTSFSNISSQARIDGEHSRSTNGGDPGSARHSYRVTNIIPVWGEVSVKYPYNHFYLWAGGSASHFSGE